MKITTLMAYLAMMGRLPLKSQNRTEAFNEYVKNDVVICPVCGKEYANGIPRYCIECKKRLESK